MQSVEVPIIDIAGFGADGSIDERICKEVSDAAQNIGFMVITGHHVPDAVIRNCWEAGKIFFDLPLADRMATIAPVSGNPYGYAPLKSESLAATLDIETPPDLKEAFSIGPASVNTQSDDCTAELFQSAENIWPINCPGFRPALEHYYATLNELGNRLLHSFINPIGMLRLAVFQVVSLREISQGMKRCLPDHIWRTSIENRLILEFVSRSSTELAFETKFHPSLQEHRFWNAGIGPDSADHPGIRPAQWQLRPVASGTAAEVRNAE